MLRGHLPLILAGTHGEFIHHFGLGHPTLMSPVTSFNVILTPKRYLNIVLRWIKKHQLQGRIQLGTMEDFVVWRAEKERYLRHPNTCNVKLEDYLQLDPNFVRQNTPKPLY